MTAPTAPRWARLADELVRRWQAGRLHRADLADWAAAQSLPELARLTAQYVTGARISHPDHGSPSHPGVDPETHEIAADLAALARAGTVPLCSQPGVWITDSGQLYDAAAYAQRAALDALAPVALGDELARRAAAAGLWVRATLVENLPRRRRDDDIEAVSVYTHSRLDGADVSVVDTLGPGEGVEWHVQTVFGAASRGHCSFLRAGVGDGADEAIGRSLHLAIVDPNWGRRRFLWQTLREITDDVR